jgi:ABC-type amino acid transport substrate-binding protein
MGSILIRRLCILSGVALVFCSAGAPGRAADTGTLERIKNDKAIRLAYREDAPPFSLKNNLGEPSGFMVDLCRAVAKKLTQQLKIPSLSVVYVPVTSVNRFDAIKDHKADILCEPTSETLSRREIVDFSIPTFVDGASLMIRADGPHDLQSMAGKKIGVLAGTTTKEALLNSLKDAGVNAEVVEAKTHADGLAMLDDDKITAYFGDRSILAFLIKESKAPDKLMLADDFLTVEPYALALPHGDEAFRLAVDRALSHIYRSDEIDQIFQTTFAGQAKPSQILQTLYLIAGLPD